MNENGIKAGKLVGVEAAKSTFRAVCLDKNKNEPDKFEIAVNPGEPTFEQLERFIAEVKNRFGAFERLGIAVPGLVHYETKRIAFSTFIPEHEQIDFPGELEASANLKITVENDANAAAYGEYILGAGRGSRDMFYATIGAGVGGALILDGKIWRGAAGFAGEFGHFAINSDGMKLEDVASSENIARRTRNRFHQDHTSSLNRLYEEQISLNDVVKAAQNGDDFARLMLDRTGNYVGMAIAGVINLLNIERVVVGGIIMQAGHLVLDAVKRRARELSFGPSFASAQIVQGELGESAAAVGAALLSAEA